MTTRDTVLGYFDGVRRKQGWDVLLAEDVVFTSLTSPNKRLSGKALFLQATQRFYGMIAAVEVRDLIVEGGKACVTTRYKLQPPSGPAFSSDVAEIFAVRDGKIAALDIYFDSAPYPK